MILGAMLTFAIWAQGENLLSNPSFEEIAPDGHPAHWSPFVMPQSGAFAEADPLARDGARAAMLHVPNFYEKEPANNWSQVVMADVAGQDLVLAGIIRTEAAGEAALWLQCFSREPARVVAAATSSATTVIAGTNEWTPVEIRLAVPTETEFVVVRCVIKGRGSAWFDALRLSIADTDTPELPAFEPEELEPALEETPGTPNPQDTDLLELSRMLNEAIAELEANNAQILERVQRIQRELEATRGPAGTEEAPLEPAAVRHPLVPHGWRPAGEPE
jgi:hypothetical protein